MKIIIEIKQSAKLERIAEFSKVLQCNATGKYPEFADVIADIHKEG